MDYNEYWQPKFLIILGWEDKNYLVQHLFYTQYKNSMVLWNLKCILVKVLWLWQCLRYSWVDELWFASNELVADISVRPTWLVYDILTTNVITFCLCHLNYNNVARQPVWWTEQGCAQLKRVDTTVSQTPNLTTCCPLNYNTVLREGRNNEQLWSSKSPHCCRLTSTVCTAVWYRT